MKTLSKATFTSLAIGALFGLNACGQQLDSPEPELDAAAQQRAEFLELHTIALPDTPYSTGLRIYTHVHALDHELMQGALRTDTTLRLAKNADARLIDFKAGDVLVSSYDRGLFRTILRVEDQGDHLLFVTRQAELEEAIAQGKLHFHKMTEAAAQAQPGSPSLPVDQDGLRTVSQGLGFKGDVEKSWDGIVKYNKDFKAEVNAKLHAMGVPSGAQFTKLGVDVNVGAELQADYDINVMPFKVDAGFTAKTNGVGVLDAQFEINTKDAKFNVEEEIYLFSTKNDNSPLVKLPAPAPLSLSLPLFPLTINFQAHGKLKALVSLDNGVNPENGEENPFIASGGARLTANLEAGLTGGLGRSWEPTFKATPNVEQIGPNFQGEKNFRAYAQLITSATVEVAGPLHEGTAALR